jgi:hypothetical protein
MFDLEGDNRSVEAPQRRKWKTILLSEFNKKYK